MIDELKEVNERFEKKFLEPRWTPMMELLTVNYFLKKAPS